MGLSESLLNAKLEAAEARTEARVARLEALVENSIKNNEKSIDDFKKDAKTTRTTVVVAAISSAIAIFIGIAGLIVAMQSNMIGSFNLGQSTKESISVEVSRSNQALEDKINDLSQQLNEVLEKLPE